MKVVFFGTSDVGLPILRSLNEQHEIVQVVTSPDAPVGRKQILTQSAISALADELKLPVNKPQKVKNNSEFMDFLRGLGADIFIVVSYGKILPAELLEIPPLKTINVHFSLLPKYRGAAPIQFSLLNGEAKTGTTIFILDELVDHGPILVQQEIDVAPSDTFLTLVPKLADLSAKLLIELLPKYQSGQIQPQEQDHSQATPTKIIKKEDGLVDWNKSAQEIYNSWRAYIAWPGIYTTWRGENFKILECSVATEHEENNSGKNDRDTITCGQNTFLKLITVQPAGKNTMSMKDFLNGYPDFQPSQLGSAQ